ncbi:MAG: hypothetical protein AB1422_15570 [bacterium]
MEDRDTAKNKEHYQISFLPWAGLKGEIKIGPITFWSFNLHAKDKIPDQEMLNHLTKYFGCYIDHQGRPVDTITICSHGNIDFRCLTNDQCTDLRSAVDILIFCTIAPQIKRAVCANNRTIGPPSAEVFQLVTQNFKPGNDHIAVRSGSLLSAGWKIGEISFPEPWSTGGSFGTPDTELIDGFNKVFAPLFAQDMRERLFRSLEWFRLAHVESDEVSLLSKVVMMATAFEILLQFPKEGKRRHFVNYMENNIASDSFNKDNRITDRGKTFSLSLAGCWAWDFYELRSTIVHGDHINSEQLKYETRDKNWLTHLIVADLVFWECIKRELFNQKCIGDNVRECAKEFDKAFPNEPEGTSEEPLARWFLGFSDMHSALGWEKEKVK